MPRFNEKTVVEDYLIEQLEKNGWSYVPANKLDRDSFEEPLLLRNLIKKLKEVNSLELTDEDINTVINELKFKPTTQEGVKQILRYFKEGIPIKLQKDKTLAKIKLFDYKNINNNEFIVTRQAVYIANDKEIRTDILLYVNGIPLVNIECKNPASFSENWFDAYKQIKAYEQYTPEVYKYIQIGVAAEQVVKYFPIVPWLIQQEGELPVVKTEEWKADNKDQIDSIIEMLSPETLLDIINNFIFFRVEFGEASKVVPRYMQYRAVNKIFDRITKNLRGKEDKDKGLIWHWQGSGKTLEMIFATNKLYRSELMENPTLFLIIDRRDLEKQLYEEFVALELTYPELIGSVNDLRKIIQHDQGKGKRGIFITIINKFRPEELNSLRIELDNLSRTQETLSTRKNVVAFIDEGHRTQHGTLAAQMHSILRNAFFFAFTGTPISKPKQGVDTYNVFSYPPEEKYLDKYFITDSIKDQFTVKIAYQPMLESEVHFNKEMLDAFLEIAYEEIPDEVREDVKENVKKKINLMKAYLENPERISKIAKNIAQHFKEHVDGKFKAMVVVLNREACTTYKKELDKYLPPEYSEIVMSTGLERKEPELIKLYVKETSAKYGKEYSKIKTDVIDKYKEEELPKILIVTDMLLTGFDAPILQTMYLDKPLKEHKLLQTIARTNRPYKGLKEAGLIIDYIGILKEFRRAFEIYSKEEIKGALFSIEDIRNDFITTLQSLLSIFKEIPKNQYDRDTLLKAINLLTAKDEQSKTFTEGYKHLERMFELLGPDTVKAENFSDYQWLTAIYIYYTRMVLREQQPKDKKFIERYFQKTVKFVHKTTKLEEIKKSLPIIEFDENYFGKLEKYLESKEEKAANMVFTLNRFMLVDRHRSPIVETLADKVQRLLMAWKEKTKDYEKIYKQGIEIINEYMKLSKRQKELDLDELQYSLLLVFEKKFGQDKMLISDVKDLTNQLRDSIFKGWAAQPTAQKNVERTLRLFIRKYIKKYNIDLEKLDSLYEDLMKEVKSYAKEEG